jgi:competence protein ComGC
MQPRRNETQRGFTLIELLVVIAISFLFNSPSQFDTCAVI